jgi:xylulokinase
MPSVVLGIDLGTTGVKVVAVEVQRGSRVASGYCAYPASAPVAGAHEQDPRDWWSAAQSALRSALSAGVRGQDVRGIGLSGHMHAVVLVDRHGDWVRPAMTWADRRSGDQVRRLREHQDTFARRCANPVVEAFTAPKLLWLAEHEPEAMERAALLVQPKDALRHELTGTWETDLSDARGTLLFDVFNDRWDPELWDLAGSHAGLAPQVASSAEVVGAVTEAAAAQTGLAVGTPVVAGASDVACSALGDGVVGPGTTYVNAGTAAQVLASTDAAAYGDYFVFGRANSAAYLVMASVYAAGLSVDWGAATLLGAQIQAGAQPVGATVDGLAAGEQPGARGVVYLPHLLGTSAPSHNALARAALLGLCPEHGEGAIARAMLEGVAFASAVAGQGVGRAAGPTRQVRLGGGLARSEVWCAAMSAVHDVPVSRVTVDPSPLGAAMLAGVGVDAWGDEGEAVDACVTWTPVEVPAPDVPLYREAFQRYRAADAAVSALSMSGALADGLSSREPAW